MSLAVSLVVSCCCACSGTRTGPGRQRQSRSHRTSDSHHRAMIPECSRTTVTTSTTSSTRIVTTNPASVGTSCQFSAGRQHQAGQRHHPQPDHHAEHPDQLESCGAQAAYGPPAQRRLHQETESDSGGKLEPIGRPGEEDRRRSQHGNCAQTGQVPPPGGHDSPSFRRSDRMSHYIVPPKPRNAATTVSSPPVSNRRSAHCPIQTNRSRLTAIWTPSPAYRIGALTYRLVKYFASEAAAPCSHCEAALRPRLLAQGSFVIPQPRQRSTGGDGAAELAPAR